MRDETLCRSRAESTHVSTKDVFLPFKKRVSLGFMRSFLFLSHGSVLVSVREGEKMSGDEVTEGSRQELDTICAAKSLFKGTVVDFDSGSHSGGEPYAHYNITVN